MLSVSPQLNIAVVTFPTLLELRYRQYLVIWTQILSVCIQRTYSKLQHQLARREKCLKKQNISYWLRKKRNINLQICPNLNKKNRPSLDYCFSCLHLFLHRGISFIYQMYVFWCSRFSVLLDLYCLVKCSYNHSLMWMTPPSPPYGFFVFLLKWKPAVAPEALAPLWTAAAATSSPF